MKKVNPVKSFAFVALAFLSQFEWSLSAQDAVKVVESYRYSLKDRVTIDFGVSSLPLDAFKKPLQVDLGVSYQFSDFFTWDVVNAGYTFLNFDTGLKNDIEDQTEVEVDEGSVKDLSFRVSSRGYLNLLYSKSNWFNRGIVYHLWQIGTGATYFHMGKNKQIAGDVVVRGRFFLNDHVTFNVAAGHSIGIRSSGPRGIMNVGLGFSYAF